MYIEEKPTISPSRGNLLVAHETRACGGRPTTIGLARDEASKGNASTLRILCKSNGNPQAGHEGRGALLKDKHPTELRPAWQRGQAVEEAVEKVLLDVGVERWVAIVRRVCASGGE